MGIDNSAAYPVFTLFDGSFGQANYMKGGQTIGEVNLYTDQWSLYAQFSAGMYCG